MSLRPSSRSQTCNLNPRCLPTCVAFGGSPWIPSHQGRSALLERPLCPQVKHPHSAVEASAELTTVLTGRPGVTVVHLLPLPLEGKPGPASPLDPRGSALLPSLLGTHQLAVTCGCPSLSLLFSVSHPCGPRFRRP